MQILEATELGGVRSAVWRFRHPVTPLSFELYPMVHAADASFYRAVEERLRHCQLVVEEGVRGGDAAAGASIAAYRLVSFHEQLGLVTQDIDPAAMGIPTINPDFSRAEFDARWREVPWRQRAVLGVEMVVSSLGARFLATRRWLAQFLAMNDLPESDEILEVDPDDPIDDLIVDQRDLRLVAALDDIHAQRAAEPIQVGVLYGAAHMRAVIHKLWALGYRPVEGAWLTVFTIDD